MNMIKVYLLVLDMICISTTLLLKMDCNKSGCHGYTIDQYSIVITKVRILEVHDPYQQC